MRFEAIKSVYRAGENDPNVFFITGDYGHANTDEFKTKWTGRYFNGGMSEQSIIGMAAGIALCGGKVVVYSITPFITLRCLEQIKIDVCDHNVDVTIIGGGSGFAYGDAGATHYSIEDIAVMRMLPHMKVVCPANPMETRILMDQLMKLGGPAYLRIGAGKELNPAVEYDLTFGVAAVLRPGTDVTIVTTGQILDEGLEAAELLAKDGISAEVLHMHTVKPLDVEAIVSRTKTRKLIVTLEEHSVFGGLGGAVAEVMAELPDRPKFKRFGVNDRWPEVVGSQKYLRDHLGISARKIAPEILALLKK